MACTPGCACSCQQTACGCHRPSPVAAPTEPATIGPLTTCRMCNRKARAQYLTTPLGKKVTVLWCGPL